MIYQVGATAYVGFTTLASTGGVANADSLPTAALRRNASLDVAVTVTVSNLSTGAYVASFAVPGDYAVGDDLEVLITAVIEEQPYKLWRGQGIVDATITSRASQTSLDTVDDFLDTEVAAIKAKTDLIPSSPAAVGSAMTLASNAVTAASLATDAVEEIAAAINPTPYAVKGLSVVVGAAQSDYIEAIAGDDKTVRLFFRDGSGYLVAIPAGATAEMQDSTGDAVGTATITASDVSVGYLDIRLEVPSTGDRPARLRVTFGGGAGAEYNTDIAMRVWS